MGRVAQILCVCILLAICALSASSNTEEMHKKAVDDGFSVGKLESGVDFKEVNMDMDGIDGVKVESIDIQSSGNGF